MVVNLGELQAELKKIDDPWVAEETCLSKLGEVHLKNRFGGVSQPSPPESPEPVESLEFGSLPGSFDWRDAEANGVKGNWMTPVKNQGNCSSCVAFGTISALEALLKINYYKDPNQEVDLSEAYLWACACGGRCNLSSIPDRSCGYLKSESGGVPDEVCCQYPPDPDQSTTMKCPGKCHDGSVPKLTRISDWSYLRGRDTAKIKESLVNNGPFIGIFYAGEDISYYVSGIYINVLGNRYDYLHCVAVAGYDDAKGCWICKDSQGIGNTLCRDWGDKGYIKIPYVSLIRAYIMTGPKLP